MMPVESRLEDIFIGQTASVERFLRADDIETFRVLSGEDQNPLHTDTAYACSHGFKDRLAYGALLGAFLSEIVGMKLPGRFSMCITQAFEFKKPFYAGDVIKLTATVVAKSMIARLVELSLVATRGDEIIATGSARVLLLR